MKISSLSQEFGTGSQEAVWATISNSNSSETVNDSELNATAIAGFQPTPGGIRQSIATDTGRENVARAFENVGAGNTAIINGNAVVAGVVYRIQGGRFAKKRLLEKEGDGLIDVEISSETIASVSQAFEIKTTGEIVMATILRGTGGMGAIRFHPGRRSNIIRESNGNFSLTNAEIAELRARIAGAKGKLNMDAGREDLAAVLGEFTKACDISIAFEFSAGGWKVGGSPQRPRRMTRNCRSLGASLGSPALGLTVARD